LTGTDPREGGDWAARLTVELRKHEEMRAVVSEAQDNGFGMDVQIDRELAGRLGVSVQTIVDTLSDAFGQRQVSTIYGQANQYRVILEEKPEYQKDPNSRSKLYVPASGIQAVAQSTSLTSTQTPIIPTVSGSPMVPLSAIARFEYGTAPLVIAHQEQFPAVTISFNLAPDAALSDAVRVITQAEQTIGMPTSVVGSYSGDTAEFAKSLQNEPWLILAAVVTIYIVLGVLYESFIHPITILSTLPSAGVGALLALMLYKQDLSVVALIGIILLMGIVKKNAIMMIDFALEAERRQGMSPREAIVQASILRFRPIMMTTLAALFGAIPLAVESGTGSEPRNPLGITIIGGLLLSQMLTLYTTPVIYLAMERLKTRFSRPRPLQTELDLPDQPEPSQRPAEGPHERYQLFRALHPPSGRHHAAGGRPALGGRGGLSLPAGRQHADGGLPDHQRHREPAGRRPRDHGVDRGGAARAEARGNPGGDRADLAQFARHHPHLGAVRPQPQHR